MKSAKTKIRLFLGVPRISMLRQRALKEFCIPVSIEFAYYCLWFPPVPIEKIEDYWRSLPSTDDNNIQECLGGEIVDHWQFIEAFPYPDRRYEAMVKTLHKPSKYLAHVCCDNDSYLSTPSGKTVLHVGSTESLRAESVGYEANHKAWAAKFFKGRYRFKTNKRGSVADDPRMKRYSRFAVCNLPAS